jgi:phosphatidylglycerol---prolipoprotein diacylglyceryl transferase
MAGPKIAFSIGPITVAWYGIIIVSAMLVATFIAQQEAKRRGADPEHVWNALMWCLVLGLAGARLYHVVSSLDYYIQNPGQVLNTRAGGLGIIGAVAGGALGLWIYARKNKLDFLFWTDVAVPGLLLAQAIGRWGNFVNQELYGYPTDLPWGIYIEPIHRLPEFYEFERFHPTFLYESLLNLLGFVLFMWLARRLRDCLIDGDLLLGYGVWYGVVRFIIEFQRPDAWTIGPLATAQWVSIAAVLVCAGALIYRHRRERRALAIAAEVDEPGRELEPGGEDC